jgi:hypothetical protein
MKGSCWANNVSHNMKLRYSAVYCDTALKLICTCTSDIFLKKTLAGQRSSDKALQQSQYKIDLLESLAY